MSADANTIPDDIVAKAGDLCKGLGIASTLANCMPLVVALHDERKRCVGPWRDDGDRRTA